MANDYSKSLTATIKGEPAVYEELFHTAEDPYELTNLANDPKYAKTLEKLRIKCSEMVVEAKGDVNQEPAIYRVYDKWLKTNYRNHQD